MRRSLAAPGLRVATARSGKEGIELARELKPALIILDVVMPGKGGIEVRAAVRAASNPVPILFSTGYSPERGSGPSIGPEPVLLKPYQPAGLLQAIRHILDARSPQT